MYLVEDRTIRRRHTTSTTRRALQKATGTDRLVDILFTPRQTGNAITTEALIGGGTKFGGINQTQIATVTTNLDTLALVWFCGDSASAVEIACVSEGGS